MKLPQYLLKMTDLLLLRIMCSIWWRVVNRLLDNAREATEYLK